MTVKEHFSSHLRDLLYQQEGFPKCMVVAFNNWYKWSNHSAISLYFYCCQKVGTKQCGSTGTLIIYLKQLKDNQDQITRRKQYRSKCRLIVKAKCCHIDGAQQRFCPKEALQKVSNRKSSNSPPISYHGQFKENNEANINRLDVYNGTSHVKYH